MLTSSIDASNRVLGASVVAGATLSTDPVHLGNLLMGQGNGGQNATLVIYNPSSFKRTEGVALQIPICDVHVREVRDDGTLSQVLSQVATQFDVNTGQSPFYDYELYFLARDLPPLGFKTYIIDPSPESGCGGGDTTKCQPGVTDSTV